MKFWYTLLMGGLVALNTAGVHASQWQALPEQAPVPADNPQTEVKVELGKMLFFDPRLSKHGTLSCNSCHNVMEGGDDSRPNSVGISDARGGRSAPSVWNAALLSVQFWDGRAASLEEQAVGPVLNPIEMAMPSEAEVINRLNSLPQYVELFKKAFPDAEPEQAVSMQNLAKAIAAYERTLITPNAPYDQYVKGEKTALTEQQVRGMESFANLGCTACHAGPNFSGPPLPVGQGFFMKFPTFAGSEYETKYNLTEDTGRAQVTGQDADKNMWRVPTLRNIAVTAPYFHNGQVPTLDEAVRVMAKTQLNKELSDNEVSDLVAFLNSLTGEFPEQTMPRLPSHPNATILPLNDAQLAKDDKSLLTH